MIIKIIIFLSYFLELRITKYLKAKYYNKTFYKSRYSSFKIIQKINSNQIFKENFEYSIVKNCDNIISTINYN